MEVAALQQKVESLGRERSAAHSPLARALVTSAGAGLRGEIERSLAKVEDARTRCLNCIRAEDAAWESRTGETVSRLVAVQREISFLNRWSDQLREGVLQLSL